MPRKLKTVLPLTISTRSRRPRAAAARDAPDSPLPVRPPSPEPDRPLRVDSPRPAPGPDADNAPAPVASWRVLSARLPDFVVSLIEKAERGEFVRPPPSPERDLVWEAEYAELKRKAAEARLRAEEARYHLEMSEQRRALDAGAGRIAFFKKCIDGKDCPSCKGPLPARLTDDLFHEVGCCGACRAVFHSRCIAKHGIGSACENCGASSTWTSDRPVMALYPLAARERL